MAASLPAKLKVPSIVPYAMRAAQLEKFKPIMSYWCNYYMVNQILAKGLHTADDECMAYTEALMEKLERAKTESPDNDAILDDVAAKAYIEQFALDTFQRGDVAIHTDRASRATIDTFQAAAQFLDMLTIWSPLEPETVAKVKYAKYHALRIAKAIKAGEDPNASNPKAEEPPLASSVAGLAPDGMDSGHDVYRPPTVESAPDSRIPTRPGSVTQAKSISSSPIGTPSNPAPVSPVEPAEEISRQGSVGGGYFPSVPSFTSGASAPIMPTADTSVPLTGPLDTAMDDAPSPAPQDFYSRPPVQAPAPVRAPAPMPVRASLPSFPAPAPQAAPAGGYRTDDEAVAAAQKHSKWAISALNFEDVPTAVKELRLALHSLGAK